MNHTNTKKIIVFGIIILTTLIGCTQTNKTSSSKNKTGSNEKPIFKFVSNSNDLEKGVDILQTNDEVSYHTFDFNKNLISYKSKTKNRSWNTFEFKIKKSKITESLLGLKGMEFDIDNSICFQIWVDTVGSIGYEFKNGQTLVFYGIQELE
ncbi:MAG: hypothetical protein GKR88_01260 [Flavobacteriaceae bacterium]|nr:MAG: hypothetical protein GKR88_01260 [Flavobacteriaceae bacterium]